MNAPTSAATSNGADRSFEREFDRAAVRALCASLPASLSSIEWFTDNRVERLSQDFYWYSPVLKQQLDGRVADIVARPKTEEEIRAVVAACASHDVPLTIRGSGTGNYGQCVPLCGGVLLDLSGFNQLLWVKDGAARAQAGLRLLDIDRAAQPQGWELRCVPSTFRSASIGGLYGGGFGGIGSINYGPLACPGNVLGVRALTMEARPRVLELRAPAALLLHHTYGTNGIVLEVEVGLAPAHPWLEAIVSFDSFDAALAFGDALANAPGIVKKSVTVMAAPIGDILMRASPYLAGAMPATAHTVLVLVAEFSEAAMQQLVARSGGSVTFRKTAEEVKKSNRTLAEYTWNHTTLHALKVDKSLTYIQSNFVPGQHLEQALKLHQLLGDEVPSHLEFIRNRDGLMTCSGLQLVRYTTEARLNEIMQIHRDHGVHINNPHVYVVEDGKQGQVNPDVVASKVRFDPQGLLNPGKLRGWGERERIMADAAAGRIALTALP